MTDRIKALLVVLDEDVREDDAKPLIDAIGQLRGVVAVQTVLSESPVQDAIVRLRLNSEVRAKLFEFIKELG